VDNVSGVQKVAFRQLRNVDQALKAFFDPDKSAKTDNIGDSPFDDSTYLVALGDILPRVGAKSLQAQGDTLLTGIHTHDMDLDFLTRMEDIAGVANPVPRQLRNVDQTLNPTQVHKRSECGQIGHSSLAYIAWL
jgi:hypothetical protein